MDKYYKDQLEDGLQFQDFVFDVLYEYGIPLISYSSKKYQVEKGENKAGIEIKYDKQFIKTGNFWIELYEKSHPSKKKWIASGILRDDNTWLYLIGNYDVFYIFPKKYLKLISNQFHILVNKRKTSKGFLLDIKRADTIAAKIIKPERKPTYQERDN